MVTVDRERCVGCGRCEKDCINGSIRVKEGKALPPEACLMCGHCVAICPVGAVSIPEYDMADVEPVPETCPVTPEQLKRLIKARRSVRDFEDRKIEPAVLKELFEAGRYTATAKNNQDCVFVLVQEQQAELEKRVWAYVESLIPESREEAADPNLRAYILFLRRYQRNPKDDYLFRNAPAVLFITSEWDLDAGLAAQNVELMAVSQGLGVQYNGYLQRLVDSSQEIKDWLGVGDRTVKACMLLGYPNVQYCRTAPRKPAQVILK